MTQIKQAGLPVVIVAVITGIIGYILGCTQSEREQQSEALAAQNDVVVQNDQLSQATTPIPVGFTLHLFVSRIFSIKRSTGTQVFLLVHFY